MLNLIFNQSCAFLQIKTAVAFHNASYYDMLLNEAMKKGFYFIKRTEIDRPE
jgi:hypothetical protein